MASILFLSRFTPGQFHYGSNSRQIRVLEGLVRLGHEIHFVQLCRRSAAERQPPALELASYRELPLIGTRVSGPQSEIIQDLLRSSSSHAKRFILRLVARPLANRISQLLEETQAQVLWVDHTDIAGVIADLPPRADILRIVDTHDVIHLREASLRQAGLPAEVGLSREHERVLLARFDLVVAIQDQERRELQRLLPSQKVITLGHATTIAPQCSPSWDVGFVGSGYYINEHGLLRFLKGAWPAIRESVPQCKLRIIGGIATSPKVMQAVRGDARVVLCGETPNIAEAYAQCGLMICPVWAGSGLKIKMVEALAFGKATVGTPVAAQGLEEAAGDAFEVAAEPEDFVEPVVRLLRSPHQRRWRERRAAAFARTKFDALHVWHELTDALQQHFQTTTPSSHCASLIPSAA